MLRAWPRVSPGQQAGWGVINGEVSALTRFRGLGWSSGTKILGAAGSDAAGSKLSWAPGWLDYRSKGSYIPGSRSGKG